MGKKSKKPAKTAVQKFEICTMKRSEILDAAVNPRELDEDARKRLKQNMKRVGLVEPVIVNRRTGRLVSGHQRLDILDKLVGNKDYMLEVAGVDIAEEDEASQVIFLNNPLAQGSYDVAKLEDVLKIADYTNCGFENSELQIMLPSWVPQKELEVEAIGGLSSELDVVLVFPDRAATDAFMDLINVSVSEKYIEGELIIELLDANDNVRV